MIKITQSKTADTRSCDCTTVSKEQLLASSFQHIGDIEKGLMFWVHMLNRAALWHDFDKISDIDEFHKDFANNFKTTGWWDNHRKVNRHHLLQEDGVPEDVNLIDVLELITDCVMAGMARTGTVYPLEIPQAVLQKAFDNTVTLLKNQIVVDK